MAHNFHHRSMGTPMHHPRPMHPHHNVHPVHHHPGVSHQMRMPPHHRPIHHPGFPGGFPQQRAPLPAFQHPHHPASGSTHHLRGPPNHGAHFPQPGRTPGCADADEIVEDEEIMKPGESLATLKKLKEEGYHFVEDILMHFYEEKEYILVKALMTAKCSLRDQRLADKVKLNVREVRRICDNVLVPQFIVESSPAGMDVRYRISPFACAVLCYRIRLLTSKAKNNQEKASENNYLCAGCGKEFDEWRVIDAMTSGLELCCGELSTKKAGGSLDSKYKDALEKLSIRACGPLRKVVLDQYRPEQESKKRKPGELGPDGDDESSKDESESDGEERKDAERREHQEKNKALIIPWLQEEKPKTLLTMKRCNSPQSVTHLAARSRRRHGPMVSAANTAAQVEHLLRKLVENSAYEYEI